MSVRVQELEAEEQELVLEHFDHTDAWRLGSGIVTRALVEGLPICLDIRRPCLILFRAAMPTITADQESRIAKKVVVTMRMEASSALVGARFAAQGFDPASIGWLDRATYAASGGSVPVRVHGAGMVAAATISGGLSSDEDHRIVVAGIRAQLAEDASP